jgi:hypothetical protein
MPPTSVGPIRTTQRHRALRWRRSAAPRTPSWAALRTPPPSRSPRASIRALSLERRAAITTAGWHEFNPSAATGPASLVYSTYLGNADSQVDWLAADSTGNTYAASSANTPTFPITSGAFQYSGYDSSSGGTYVTKLNPTGTALVYSAYLGYGTPNGIAVEQGAANPNAYVTGTVGYADWPTTAGAYQTSYAGAFAVKLNSTGTSEVYSTFLGGPSSYTGNNVVPYSIALPNGCSSSCNAYISGWTNTSDFPVINPIQNFNPSPGGSMAFVTELAADGGSALFSTYLSGLTTGVGNGCYYSGGCGTPAIAVDNGGNMSVVGNLNGGSDFPITVATSNSYGFLAKISPATAPYLWATPSSVNFGNQPVLVSTNTTGNSATVYLRNLSGTAATISSIVIAPASIFFETNNCGSSIPAGGYCTLNLSYTPGGTNTRNGTVTVTSNASDPVVIPVSGTGVDAAVIQPSVSGINFPNQAVGTSSAVQQITLTNVSTESTALTISVGTVEFTQLNNCPSQLSHNHNCVVNVTFSPTDLGLWTDTVTVISSNGPNVYISLSGTGVTSASSGTVILSSASLDFGTEAVGSTTAAQQVYIENQGSIPITVQSVTAAGDFAVTGVSCTLPAIVIPQGYCYANVTFTPTAAGTRTGTMTFNDSASGSPQTVALSGTGLADVQTAEFYPATGVVFPDQPVGYESGAATVYLENTGTTALAVDRVLISTGFEITSTNCPATSVAGQLQDGSGSYHFCSVNVAFTPAATGFASGTLTFTDSAGNSPQTVALSGTGIADSGTLALDPTQLDYNTTQLVGTTTATQLVTFSNPGNSTVTVNSYSTGASAFSAQDYNCGATPIVITGGGSCSIQISFTPTTAGTAIGTLAVSSTAGNFTAALSGGGVAATEAIAFTPASPMNEGSFVVGVSSGGGVSEYYNGDLVSIRNTGTSPVTFSADPSITGTNAGDFSLNNPYQCGISGTQLAANSSCPMWVTFTPGATGSRTANLIFTDDAPGGTQTLVLKGTGLASSPNYSLSNGLLSFDNQVQGTTSPLYTYIYFYNNAGSVTLGQVSITGNFLIPNGYDYCSGQIIANHGSCYLYVKFAPASGGYLTGTLTFKNSGGTTLASSPLEGYAPADVVTALVDPTTINFANEVVGLTSSYQQLFLTNTGNVPMTLGVVSGTNLGTPPAQEFSIGSAGGYDNCSGATVQAGSNCSIGVTFTPNATGARTGTAVFPVTYFGGSTANFTANLAGTGLAEVNSATVSPSTGSFTDQTVGVTTSYDVTLVLTNNGNKPFTVGTLTGTNTIVGASATGEFSTNPDNCTGATVNPSATCSVYVYFTPSATGTRHGNVSFPITYADSTTANPMANLTGIGVAPSLTLQFSPLSVVFPVQIVNTTSGEALLTVTNTGNAPVTIGTDMVSGPFAVGPDGDGCSGATLAYNQICYVYLVFSPTATGAVTGTFTLADDSAGGPHNIALAGTGIAANQQIAITPTTLNFGNQPAGTTSTQQTIWVTNQGDSQVDSFSASLVGTNAVDFTVNNTCNPTPPARYTCAIVVNYTPQTGTLGAQTATVALATSVAGETAINVTLNGTAVTSGPAIGFSPSPLVFPTQNVGTSSTGQTFSVTNTGNANLNITNVALGGTNASEFSITADGCAGATLTPGQNCIVHMKFSPLLGGTRTATVSITDNASGSPQTQTVNGTGHGIPVASLSPTTVPFGNSSIGTATGAQNITLTNTGTDVLNISNVVLTGADPGDFSISNNGCGSTLAATITTPYPSCVIAVTFTPTAAGNRGADLTITDNSNNATGATQIATLTGTGVGVPNAGLSTNTLPSFGNQNIGTTSAAQTVTVSNTGTGPLSIASIVVGGTNPGDFGQTNNCGATLVNGSSCTLSVTFTPSASGARSATITLTDNANNVTGATQVISASGTGVGVPQGATTAPSSLVFVDQNVGTTSAAQSVTLTNNGTGALTITSIAINGTNSGDFAQNNTCGGSLAGNGATCNISVTFTPTAPGSRTANLVITDNAGGHSGTTQSVTLNGTAVGVPAAGVSPSSLTFSSQNVGTTSSAKPVTLSNTGTGALTVSSISIGGTNPADFGQTNNCGSSVAAGGSCTINVTFSPTAAGSRAGTLIVSDNSNNTASSQTVGLTGTGVALPIGSPAPGSLSFGNQTENSTSAAQSVTLTNTGSSALTITSIAIGGTNPTDFAQTNNCPSSLGIGANCTISVTFTPLAVGSLSGTLTITDNSGNVSGTQQNVGLTGTGIANTVVPAPVSTSPINGSGSPQAFTMTYSDGNGTSDITYVYILFNPAQSYTYGCYIASGSGTMYLRNDANTAWTTVPVGSSTPLSNSQCTLTGSSVGTSGNNLMLKFTLAFAAGFSGQKNVYTEAYGKYGTSSWKVMGTWTPAARQALTAGPISPINSAGASQTFSLTFNDPNGTSDMYTNQVLFSTSPAALSNACWIYYSASSNLLYLRNNANTAWSTGITPGSSTQLSNSQCTLTGSSVAATPGGVTLGLSLTFSGTFTGTQNVYMDTVPFPYAPGTATGYQLQGTWTP